ncbi:agmatine ureohydrolase [Salmonella enterica subsp. enterica]|uniref:Agmatine ureohydrolase n=1 Tax=Salmonella enterica I TaxID=59201 RepID=A0A379WMS6_SALET|nr:agmatine ureohydrolase [Salmonella enterica subsp. enterica]
MSTLGHQYDNSLVSNAFGFLRLPMNFQPYDSDADWVITGVPFDMATSGRAGVVMARRRSVRCRPTSPGNITVSRGILTCASA